MIFRCCATFVVVETQLQTASVSLWEGAGQATRIVQLYKRSNRGNGRLLFLLIIADSRNVILNYLSFRSSGNKL